MDNSSQTSAAQFRPMVPNQHGQPFIPTSQQFQPVGQSIPPPNIGMPPAHSQPLQFSQPMQQYPPRPIQPGHAMPLSQGLPMSYIQTRPVAPGPPQSQQPAAPFTNQMPSLPGGAMPFSSYSYAPSSFGQPQNNASSVSQFQPMSQMLAPAAPAAPCPGQPWVSSGSQSALPVTSLQQVGQQPSVASSAEPLTDVPSATQQSSSYWQEHTSSDGRRYYYNKRTKQSVWDKPLELMTPIEMSWQVWRNFTPAPICSL